MEVVIDMEALLTRDAAPMEEEQPGHRIFRVPQAIKKRNPDAYNPQMVSIGPYHYGEPHLQPMNEKKRRALHHLLYRTGRRVEDFLEPLKWVASELTASYELLDEKWLKNEDRFLQLMLLDGAFLVEFQRRVRPILSERSPSELAIEDDLNMLENQLPRLVVLIINAVAEWRPPIRTQEKPFIQCISDTWKAGSREGFRLCEHRKALIGEENFQWVSRDTFGQPKLKSVGVYKRAGILFSCTGTCLLSSFYFDYAAGMIKLPVFYIVPGSDCLYLNSVAYERLCADARHIVSSFLWILNQIVQSSEDAGFLESKGHTTEATVVAIRKICYDMNFVPYKLDLPACLTEHLEHLYQMKNQKWTKRFREWRLTLWETCFKNPWTLSSVVAAFLILVFSFCQTLFSILAYYK